MDASTSISSDLSEQAGPANKRPRLEKAQDSTTASQRFFQTPELVFLLLTYLSRERIDLLTLSLVCKALRIQSLKIWVRELDLYPSNAHHRFEFFKAIPTLLKDVRFLRVRDDPYARRGHPLCCADGSRDWSYVNELLHCMARNSSSAHDLPLLHVEIDRDPECFGPPIELTQRITALSVCFRDLRDYRFESDSDEEHDEDTNQRKHQRRSDCAKLIAKVTDILQHAKDGPGLCSFRLEVDEKASTLIKETFWEQLVRHAPTMQELSIFLAAPPLPRKIFSALDFERLERLNFSIIGEVDMALIEGFLDRAGNLRELEMDASDSDGLSFRQTFPHLRAISVESEDFDLDDARRFAERHPHVVRLGFGAELWLEELVSETSSSAASSAAIFPNLKCASIRHPPELQQHFEAGRFPTKIAFVNRDSLDDMKRSMALLLSNSTAAEEITCLELFVDPWDALLDILNRQQSSPGSHNFPNLTEIRVNGPWHFLSGSDSDSDSESESKPDSEPAVEQLVAALIPARSLKVLRLYWPEIILRGRELLRDRDFPPAMEYLDCDSRCFRFVSSDPEGRIVKTTTGGKKGRLEQVPRMYRTQITRSGVWHSRMAKPVLDHLSGGSPSLLRD